MKSARNTDILDTTSRLLLELDEVLDRSSIIREIYNTQQRLYAIECVTGESKQTRKLRARIKHLEDQLDASRSSAEKRG